MHSLRTWKGLALPQRQGFQILTLGSENGGSAIKIAYLSDSNTILAVYDDGSVLTWDVETLSVVTRYRVDIASTVGLEFDKSGSLLMAAGHRYVAELHAQMTELVSSIAIWSTGAGEKAHCLSFTCDPTGEIPLSTGNPAWKIGAILNPAGEWSLLYSEYNITVQALTGQGGDQAFQINAPDDEYWWHIGKVAFDEVHQRFAIVYQEGRIELRLLGESTIGGLSVGDPIVSDGTRNEMKPVTHATFDPSGRRLAVVRNNELAIWNLEGEIQYALVSDAQGVITVTFDRSGQLLIVAATDLVTMWDVEERVVVAQIETPNVSTLSISQDNRLLLWGDSEGKVHVWGIQAIR